ncbi:MAG: hypothetical protein J6A88_02195 [Oscillospiraceae bacterium]|nr:hypothetical protein [Oscillospiraceae bacterium]
MNSEQQHYAISLDGGKLSSIPKAGVWFLLSVFLIPTLIMHVWIGLAIIILYLILSHCVKKENDLHSKGLLKWGQFLCVLGIECAALTILRFNVIKPLLICMFCLLIAYEFIFALKIKLKIYSGTDKAQKKVRNVLTATSCLCGFSIGRLLARFGDTDVVLWIMTLLCSVLVVGSITVFQKVLVYKIIKE